jgi:Family of unknown function (DUF6011)
MTTTYTIKDPTAKASDAQVSYLNSLLNTRDNATVAARARFALASNALTKGLASSLIDQLKNSPVKPAQVVQAAKVDALAELPVVDYGYYQMTDPHKVDSVVLFVFDEFKTQGTTKVKFMKLKETQVYDYKTGQYLPKGQWVYAGSKYTAKKMLAGQSKLTMEQAAKIGKQVGFCIRCGRTLTDPESVANGIGPVCATYVNWAN